MADETREAVDSGIVEMWRKDGRLYAIAGLGVGLVLGVIILPAIAALDDAEAVQAFLNDLAPEAVGILVTVFGIDQLNRRRSKRETEEAMKQQLKDDAASISNEVAKNAVHQMRRKGWLTGEDGLLKLAYLRWANLESAYLRWANLKSADLRGANLEGAYLRGADLENGYLRWANLKSADLRGANLEGAYLRGANLEDAYLYEANLESAYLYEANLKNAKLERTAFNEKTRLPDETYWTPETEMARFTNPDYHNFWRSDNKNSPAYRGKDEE